MHILFKTWIYKSFKEIQNTLIFIHSTDNSKKQFGVCHRNLWKSSETLSLLFSTGNKEKNRDKQHGLRRGIYDKQTHTQDKQSPHGRWLSVSFLARWFTAPTNEKFSFFFFLELHLFNWVTFLYKYQSASLLLSIILVTASGFKLCSSLGEQKSVGHFTKHYLSSPRGQGESFRKCSEKSWVLTSLVIRWLRSHLPMQETEVRSLVQQLGSHMSWGN